MSSVLYFIFLSLMFKSLCIWRVESTDQDFSRKQELILQLLWNTREVPTNHPEIFERVKNYKIEDLARLCENQTHGKEFESLLKNGKLLRGQLFSIFKDEHVHEVRTIFNAFQSAKNFDDFMVMAARSSLILNELSWFHGFATALTHRPDTKYLRMPNLYEILPHYFFNTDVIIQAYRIKTGEVAGNTEHNTIEANYSGEYQSQDEAESKLNYFYEDIGLNEFHFYFVASFPFWLKAYDLEIDRDLRGELYYYVHKMFLTRYKLERSSNGLGEIEDIDWDQPIVTGFYPSMTHLNGQQFPTRPAKSHVPVRKYTFLEEIKHFESRITKAIDLGDIRKSNSESTFNFGDLCNTIEGNADSVNLRLYGSLDRNYRRVLGFAARGGPLSALETSLAALRDPGFYRLAKRIVNFGLRLKRNLQPYTHEELNFDGLRIDYVRIERISTCMDNFDSVLNHPRVLELMDEVRNSQTIKVIARQIRLQHKPFNYEIGVTSEHANKAIVRIFIGPKFDYHGNEVKIEDVHDDFYEVDRWIVDMKQGSNKIVRNSQDSIYGMTDSPSSDTFNQLITQAQKFNQLDKIPNKFRRGFPTRLLIPRGTNSGLQLRFVFSINSIEQKYIDKVLNDHLIFGGLPLDGRALGFPFDRPFGSNIDFRSVRNVMIKDVRIYYEDVKSNVD